MESTTEHPLTSDQQAQLHDDGFLIVRGLLPPSVVAALVDRLSVVVDELALAWHREGLLDDLHEDLDFAHRFATLRRLVPATAVTSWRTVLVSPELHALWREPRLAGAIQSLLGPEIFAHGIWNGRPREPGSWDVQRVSWHQDAAYYDDWDPAEGLLVTCWTPLVPVAEETGCLQVARRSHTQGYIPFVRAANGIRSVPPDVVSGFEIVSCVMEPGDVLFFHPTTLHQALDNRSTITRWSVDIRFGPATSAIIAKGGPGFVCASAEPDRVESFTAWSARYDSERRAAMAGY